MRFKAWSDVSVTDQCISYIEVLRRIMHFVIKCLFLLLSICILSCGGGSSSSSADEKNTGSSNPVNAVTITDKGGYYLVEIDYTQGKTHEEIGTEYAADMLVLVPNVETLIDSYIYDLLYRMAGNYTDIPLYMIEAVVRVEDIKINMPLDYINEINGIASVICSTTADAAGDGKLSKTELYLINLIADVVRGTQCSAISVFGSSSSTGTPIVARNLDWFGGSSNQLAKIQAVTVYKNGSKSVCSIGYLGFAGVLTGFNKNGVYAAVLDSSTSASYTSSGKSSYPFDLRKALESALTLDDVSAYMSSTERDYAFNHNIILSDTTRSAVLENNFSGNGSAMKRSLRTYSSVLNMGVTWGFINTVGCVNSFILSGNHDNHTGRSVNYTRWASMKTKLSENTDLSGKVTTDGMKIIIGYNGSDPLYITESTSGNQQCIIFQPALVKLEVSFRGRTGTVPVQPLFAVIPVSF